MSTISSEKGTKQVRDGRVVVEFRRTFRAPIEDVWAAVTESDRLGRWIGTWWGDPSEGQVTFRMGFEGEDTPAELFRIDECEAPRLLRITSTAPQDWKDPQIWHFRLDLTEDEGVTTLVFSQDVPDLEMAEGVGPGWHYYLDRLVAAETGADVSAVDFDDYYPALQDHYREAFAEQR